MKNFLHYYQDELLALRKKGGEFAKKYPDVAKYIDIQNGQSVDPHTERIIEAVAFMSAQLHQKIDNNAENIAFHILNAVYPNLINFLPPFSVVQFKPRIGQLLADKLDIPRTTRLSTVTQFGVRCLFQTLYPLTIYPLNITDVYLEKNIKDIGGTDWWEMKIDIATNSVPIEMMNIDTLLFHINSEIIEDALILYESIFANSQVNAFIVVNNKIIKLQENSVIPSGFNEQDTICPTTPYSSNTFQLFQEVLHCKKKYMFFEVKNINEAIKSSGVENISEFSIIIDIAFTRDRLLQIVQHDVLMINCVPIVNLFRCSSDPFKLTGEHNKYLLLADQLRDKEIEIHSIESVHIISGETAEDSVVQPYFALSVDSDTNIQHDLFWIHSREPANVRGLAGKDIFLSFIDLNLNPYKMYDDVVYAKLLCTNRIQARDIPIGAAMEIEELETGDVSGYLLYKTSDVVEFATDTTNLWHLVSQLSSTNISMAKEENLWASIKQLLIMFSAGVGLRAEELMEPIKRIETSHIVKRFGSEAWRGFVRGIKFDIYIDENYSYMAFILCSILNQYLSSCITLNSFVQLNMISNTTNVKIAEWLASSGRKNVI